MLSLVEGSRRLDIDTIIDWQECEKILKAAFPLDVRAAESSAEIPFGHVRRPTHTNTSWDGARFEICAHRYLHLTEPGWGAALVNDSSYGHDVSRDVRPDGGTTTTARISLLRAPLFPDPDSDRGEHRLRYALVLGADVQDAVREGYHFNLPERAVPGRSAVDPLVRVEGEGVVIEAVKLADDRSGDVVVRLYESAAWAGAHHALGRLLPRRGEDHGPAGASSPRRTHTVLCGYWGGIVAAALPDPYGPSDPRGLTGGEAGRAGDRWPRNRESSAGSARATGEMRAGYFPEVRDQAVALPGAGRDHVQELEAVAELLADGGQVRRHEVQVGAGVPDLLGGEGAVGRLVRRAVSLRMP